MSLPDLDLTRDIAGKARALTDTTGIAAGLSRLQATTLAAERLARPIDFGARIGERAFDEPALVMPAITPYHPEVDAIDALGDRIDAMAQNQARADRDSLEVMTAQSELIRKQGEAIELVAAGLHARLPADRRAREPGRRRLRGAHPVRRRLAPRGRVRRSGALRPRTRARGRDA